MHAITIAAAVARQGRSCGQCCYMALMLVVLLVLCRCCRPAGEGGGAPVSSHAR
jgi:hypothetical protein